MEAAGILSPAGIEAEVVNMRFAKPVDNSLIQSLAGKFDTFVTVEDNVTDGGFGTAVLESLSRQGLENVRVRVHGLPDEFVEQGTPAELYRLLRLDGAGIAGVVQEFLQAGKQAVTK
jgi:1-deoxy-D-xylulose-5-phosphate synthase